jgi:hypothetical protein
VGALAERSRPEKHAVERRPPTQAIRFERVSGLDFEIAATTPEYYGNYIKSEIQKWAKVVKLSGARPE